MIAYNNGVLPGVSVMSVKDDDGDNIAVSSSPQICRFTDFHSSKHLLNKSITRLSAAFI